MFGCYRDDGAKMNVFMSDRNSQDLEVTEVFTGCLGLSLDRQFNTAGENL